MRYSVMTELTTAKSQDAAAYTLTPGHWKIAALAEVLEDWLFFRIHRHLPLPKIDGIALTVKKEKAA